LTSPPKTSAEQPIGPAHREYLSGLLVDLGALLDDLAAKADAKQESLGAPAKETQSAASDTAFLKRWKSIFSDEIDLVRLARNSVVHGTAISDDNLESAIRIAERVLEAAYRSTRSGGSKGDANGLRRLADIYQARGRYREAADAYERVIAILREKGDHRSLASALTSLADTYRQTRQYAEAISAYQQALKLFRQSGDQRGEAQALVGLGSVYRELRRPNDAAAAFEQALALGEELGDRYRRVQSLVNLGNIYRELHLPDKAIAALEQSLALQDEIGDQYGKAQSLINLGNIYRELHRPDEAANRFTTAADLLDSIDPSLAQATRLKAAEDSSQEG